ncbi:unnamed protein product [Oreochromis niloticus]|nr:unnamed protein product [Mustela putorius furo]
MWPQGDERGSVTARGPPLQLPAPLQERCTVAGLVGHLKGLYLSCCVEDQPCQALVDTGSTISLIRPGVFPGTSGPLVMGWSPTDTQLMTVTGERTDMRGKKPLRTRGERAQEARGVVTARATADGGGWLSLTMQQLKQEQEADATLVQVGAWLEAARRPGWTGVSGQGPEVKAYYSQYNNLETRDGLLYRRWDCYRRLRERPRVVHDYTCQAQVSAGVRQKRACDTRCRGGAFVPGDKVWVYCPVRKRGVSPRLCGHWQGPAEVVGRLTEVVYRIRMPGPGRVAVLHQDRLSPYRPPAPAAAGAGDSGGTPGSHPSDSSPAGRDRPAGRRKTHGHVQDFVLGNGVVGDD